MPLTEAEVAALHQRATQAARNSYSPYIHFCVGAAALLHADQRQDGAFRQAILEFATPETAVFYPSATGETVSTTLAALLPDAFRLTHE